MYVNYECIIVENKINKTETGEILHFRIYMGWVMENAQNLFNKGIENVKRV